MHTRIQWNSMEADVGPPPTWFLDDMPGDWCYVDFQYKWMRRQGLLLQQQHHADCR